MTGPTATPTPTLLHHFHCYEVDRAQPYPTISGIRLDDQFGTGTVNLMRPSRFCNPANKNDEDPAAPFESDHLLAYEIEQTSPRFTQVPDVEVVNQFGSIFLDVIRPDRLFVPTAKSLDGAPPPLTDPGVDHFKCYVVQRATTRVPGVLIEDQFGMYVADVKRPVRLCMAADKNGEGVLHPTAHLMCYEIDSEPSRSRYRGQIFTDNQFGPDTIGVTGPRELCLPSEVYP